MKKILIIGAMLWTLMCFAAPSVTIGAGTMRYSNDAYVYVNGGSISNANSGTPFYAVNTKTCSSPTTFYGPEGSQDALVITPSGNMGSTTVSIYSGSYHPNTSTSVLQWWNINPTTAQTCNLEFRFRNAYLGSLNLANLAVWEYSGTWVKLSENITASNTGSSFTSVTFGNVTFEASKAAHQIIIADKSDHTLPVEMSYYNATATATGYVSLMWMSQSENALLGYYVRRAEDNNLVNSMVVSELIPATNTSTQQTYIYTDESLLDNGTWYYWLQAVSLDGSEQYYGSMAVEISEHQPPTPDIPLFNAINNLYPNPFNPDLTISYSLKDDNHCAITILNLRGQVIRNMQDTFKTAGTFALHWDGLDNNGKAVASGVYFVRMTAGKETFLKRAVLMK